MHRFITRVYATSGDVSEPIDQTTTTELIKLVLAAYPVITWDRKNAKR